MNIYKGNITGEGFKFGIVVSRYNELITKRLLVEIITQELKEVFGTAYGSFPKRDDDKKKGKGKGSFKFDPNSTKNQGRWRLKDPDAFERMWTRQDKNDARISFIVGTFLRESPLFDAS